MINTIVQAIQQVLILSLIPLVVFLIHKKTFKGFMSYIGLKRSNSKANGLALLLMILLATPMLSMAYFDDEFKQVMLDPKSVSGNIRAMGFGLNSIVTIFFRSCNKKLLFQKKSSFGVL